MRLLIATALLATAACAGQAGAPGQSPAPTIGGHAVPLRPIAADLTDDLPRHELIFARHADDARTDYDIWRMCGDGTQLASLVVLPGHQYQIAVSPDGKEFVYTSRVDGKNSLWRKRFAGGRSTPLLADSADASGPSWSPDGKRIAFFSTRDAPKQELYLFTLADSAITRVTTDTLYDSGASWHPDGSRIAFTRFFPGVGDVPGHGEVMELELATGRQRQLTDLGGYNGGVAYSPDGQQIAFHRAAESGAEIWLMDADGSNARAITATRMDEYSPSWSPDGRWLAISAGTGHDGLGTFDIWLMRPDGSDRRLLHAGPNTEAWQVWRGGENYCR